jgi:hypothetical protein
MEGTINFNALKYSYVLVYVSSTPLPLFLFASSAVPETPTQAITI